MPNFSSTKSLMMFVKDVPSFKFRGMDIKRTRWFWRISFIYKPRSISRNFYHPLQPRSRYSKLYHQITTSVFTSTPIGDRVRFIHKPNESFAGQERGGEKPSQNFICWSLEQRQDFDTRATMGSVTSEHCRYEQLIRHHWNECLLMHNLPFN